MLPMNPGHAPTYETDPVARHKAGKKLNVYDQLVAFQDLTNLRVDEVRRLLEKIGVPIAGQDDKTVMAICHYCRMKLLYVSDADKKASEDWLRFNQFPL